MIELISRIPVQSELGEGIIWDNQRQRLWWTDIDNCQLYRYDPITGNLEQWSTPERLCCFAPVVGQEYLVAAFASGFAFYDPLTGSLDWIKKIESDNPGTRLNDGRTDRQGRMWAGTMVEDSDLALYRGSLYCLDNELVVSKTIGDLLITNSLCWSPDSKRSITIPLSLSAVRLVIQRCL
jgi:L-arabinonolactonase